MVMLIGKKNHWPAPLRTFEVNNKSEWDSLKPTLIAGDRVEFDGAFTGNMSANIQGTRANPITLTAKDKNNPPTFDGQGGTYNGFTLTACRNVRLTHFHFINCPVNNLRVESGESSPASNRTVYDELSPSRYIWIEDCFCDLAGEGGAGNDDGIKIGQTDHWHILRTKIRRWARGPASGIDVTGCQYGKIYGCDLNQVDVGGTSTGITCKGGTRFMDIGYNILDSAGIEMFQWGQQMNTKFLRQHIETDLKNGTKFQFEAATGRFHNNICLGDTKAHVQYMKGTLCVVENNTFINNQLSGEHSFYKIAKTTSKASSGDDEAHLHGDWLTAQENWHRRNLYIYWDNPGMWTSPFCRTTLDGRPELDTFYHSDEVWWHINGDSSYPGTPQTENGLMTAPVGMITGIDPELEGMNMQTGVIADPYQLKVRSTNPVFANVGSRLTRP